MQEPKIKRDFERVKGDWDKITGDFKNAADSVSQACNAFESVIDIILDITGYTIEIHKEALLARQHYLARLKEVQNLRIKMFTLGLTHDEKKRLHDGR